VQAVEKGMKSREQFIMLSVALVGLFAMQIGLYELVRGSDRLLVFPLLVGGSDLALFGFDRYRTIEDEDIE
jgi:hypothetical protein